MAARHPDVSQKPRRPRRIKVRDSRWTKSGGADIRIYEKYRVVDILNVNTDHGPLITLAAPEARRLRDWLTKAIAWMEQQK